MKYCILTARPATLDNWKILLFEFSGMPRSTEPFVRALHEAAHLATINRNTRSEMVVFLDSIWDRRWCGQGRNVLLETDFPHDIQLTRWIVRSGVIVTLRYADYTGRGSADAEIHLSIRGKDPEAVRRFAHEAAGNIGPEWYGSLHYGENQDVAPQTAFQKSIDVAIDALKLEALRWRETTAEVVSGCQIC